METAAHIRRLIKTDMEIEGIICTEENRRVAQLAMINTLDCLTEFVTEVSKELVGAGLHSEAMVSGVISQKLKNIRRAV